MSKMIDKLLVKAEYFEKISGVLQAPPSMVKEITDWAISRYAKKNYDNLINLTNKTVENKFDIAQLKKYINPKFRDADTNYFKITLQDLPYFTQSEVTKFFYEGAQLPKILVQFVTNEEQRNKVYEMAGGWSGLWEGNSGKLYIYEQIPDAAHFSMEYFLSRVNNIKITVRHELQHLTQIYLKNIKNLNESGGLPGKNIKENDFDPYGYSKKRYDAIPMLEYELKDGEFYTNLTDSIEEFKNIIPKFPKRIHNILFNLWIDRISPQAFKNAMNDEIKSINTSEAAKTILNNLKNETAYIIDRNRNFFQDLKNKRILKYNKAVKEFYKAVSDLL